MNNEDNEFERSEMQFLRRLLIVGAVVITLLSGVMVYEYVTLSDVHVIKVD